MRGSRTMTMLSQTQFTTTGHSHKDAWVLGETAINPFDRTTLPFAAPCRHIPQPDLPLMHLDMSDTPQTKLYTLKTNPLNRGSRILHEKYGWLSVVFTSYVVAKQQADLQNRSRVVGSVGVFETDLQEIETTYSVGGCVGYWLVGEDNKHDTYPLTNIVLLGKGEAGE
jgi:hypothetical protein